MYVTRGHTTRWNMSVNIMSQSLRRFDDRQTIAACFEGTGRQLLGTV